MVDNITQSIEKQVLAKCLTEIYCNNCEGKIEGNNFKEKFKSLLEAFNQ